MLLAGVGSMSIVNPSKRYWSLAATHLVQNNLMLITYFIAFER